MTPELEPEPRVLVFASDELARLVAIRWVALTLAAAVLAVIVALLAT